MQIYIDDSGNIVNGLGNRASRKVPYFVLAALVLREGRSIKRCIKDVRRTIRKKDKDISELKFNNSDATIKRRILECIGRTNNEIGYAVLCNCEIQHQVEPRFIYNDICKQLVYRIINSHQADGRVDVFIFLNTPQLCCGDEHETNLG
jgi:hypothetical protein